MRMTMKGLSFALTLMLAFVPGLAGAGPDDIGAPTVRCAIVDGQLMIDWDPPTTENGATVVKYSVDVVAYYDTVPEEEGYEAENEFEVGTVHVGQPLEVEVPLNLIPPYQVDETIITGGLFKALVKGLHHGQANRQNHPRGFAYCE